MFGGGGGLDPSKMEQMMKQMGIDVETVDAEEVVIHTEDEELVFRDAEVTLMDAQGQQTYQIVGEPDVTDRVEADVVDAADDGPAVPNEDVEIVAQRTGASEDAAREALVEADGDLAAAIDRLE
ncbi:nascent polypeptide-associated complex protein [Halobacteriales archaeon SW_7_68_16]|nr:MAG: nascent polypeptide-associated complex protein [Halobacteriales archaeon SW_7_68_16]